MQQINRSDAKYDMHLSLLHKCHANSLVHESLTSGTALLTKLL